MFGRHDHAAVIPFDGHGTTGRDGHPLGALDLPADGPATLETARRKGLVFFVAFAAFALFWNGIVGFLITGAVGTRVAGGHWLHLLFFIPFVAAGLAMLAGVGYFALSLTNPRPVVVVSTARAEPGGKLEVEWRLDKRSGRLRRLTVSLEAREEATYRRGTDMHTARDTFHSQLVAERAGRESEGAGSAEVTIPEGTMHSFEGRSNAVRWCVRVQGEIPRWPDIDVEFPIVVVPPGLDGAPGGAP